MAKKSKQPVTKRSGPAAGNKTPTWVWIAAAAVASVLLVVGLFYLGTQGSRNNISIEGVQFLSDPGRGHLDGDITYQEDVPAGGQHNPIWQNCGIYDEPIRTENAIHSMEHGAVWITYQPDLAADQVELLRDAVRQARRSFGQSMVLLSPKAELNDPIVLTAWRVQLRLDDAADERIADFLTAYQAGPFTPEPGATCQQGVGTPIN